ncbi:MAG: hypothetical protein HPY53_03115 [Brevinematales bacterium]|nr:hypothetical protein [Brevinematales bacterium]
MRKIFPVFMLLLMSCAAETTAQKIEKMKEPVDLKEYTENIKTLIVYQTDIFREALSNLIAIKKSSANFQDYLKQKIAVDDTLYKKSEIFNQKNREQMTAAKNKFDPMAALAAVKSLDEYQKNAQKIFLLYGEFNINETNFSDPKFDNFQLPESK